MKPQDHEAPHHAAENAAAAAAHPATAAAAASASAPAAEKRGPMVGGVGSVKPADDNAKSVLSQALPQLVAQLPQYANAAAELVSYSTQVVAGLNYFMKVRFGADKFVHARVWLSPAQEVTLHSVQENKTLEAPINYF